MKKVFAMASIPQREPGLERVLNSICSQVDSGFIILNNYKEIPSYLKNYNNLTVITSQEIGDMEAKAKFYPLLLLKEEVMYFTCDDDLIYPSNYFKYMAERAEELNSIITQHGRRFLRFPISDFLHDITCVGTHFKIRRNKDTIVNFAGTGVMCFSTELFKIKNLDFIKTNFPVDAWIGLEAFKKGIKIVCVKSQESIEFLVYDYTLFGEIQKDKSEGLRKLIVDSINSTFKF